MNVVKSILRELLGLFIDDGNLALHVLVLVLGDAVLVEGLGLAPLAGGGLLLGGCLLILAFSLRRKLRNQRR